MLALKIMKDVIQKDAVRKQKETQSLGALASYGAINPDSALATLAAAAATQGAGYGLGQYVLEDNQVPEGFGRDAEWMPTVLSTMAASLVVPSLFSIGDSTPSGTRGRLGEALDTLESLALFYHGYKRHNDDILWALGWAFFGNAGFAAAQGFAKPLQKD